MEICPVCKLPKKMFDPKEPTKALCGNRRCGSFQARMRTVKTHAAPAKLPKFPPLSELIK